MNDIMAAIGQAFALIAQLDAGLVEIVVLSLQVTASAVLISCVIGFPLGAILAIGRFPGRRALRILTSATMGLPPVVVGLIVYMMLSQSGPLAVLNLLYTPTAMIIAQIILVVPIITALSAQAIEDLHGEYRDLLRVMGANRVQTIGTLLWDARAALITATLAGFGRAFAEVGAVMIVGGNINHLTRVMTTAIALETSKGALALALALGIVLLIISIAINAGLMLLRGDDPELAHA